MCHQHSIFSLELKWNNMQNCLYPNYHSAVSIGIKKILCMIRSADSCSKILTRHAHVVVGAWYIAATSSLCFHSLLPFLGNHMTPAVVGWPGSLHNSPIFDNSCAHGITGDCVLQQHGGPNERVLVYTSVPAKARVWMRQPHFKTLEIFLSWIEQAKPRKYIFVHLSKKWLPVSKKESKPESSRIDAALLHLITC